MGVIAFIIGCLLGIPTGIHFYNRRKKKQRIAEKTMHLKYYLHAVEEAKDFDTLYRINKFLVQAGLYESLLTTDVLQFLKDGDLTDVEKYRTLLSCIIKDQFEA